MKSPFFVRVDYNEVADDRRAAVERPARHRLRQRPDRVRAADRLQDARTPSSRRGYKGKSWNVKLALPRQQVRQQEPRRRSGRTSSCAARWTPRCSRRTTSSRSGRSSGSWRDLPLRFDGAGALHAEQAHQRLRRRWAAASSRTSNAGAADQRRLPRHRAELVDVRRRASRRRRRRSRCNSTPLAGPEHAALLRVLRQGERLDADHLRGRRAAGAEQPDRRPASQHRDAVLHGRVRRRPSPSSTRRTSSASTRTTDSRPSSKLLRRPRRRQTSTATLEPAPQTDDTRGCGSSTASPAWATR